MSRRGGELLAAVPPFLVGVVAAVSGEIAVGLLLYTGPGFLRALTVILAVLLGALSLGLWTGPAPGPEPGARVEALRRRWLLALLCLVGAAVTAGAWNVLGGLSGASLSRGLGLAFLAGLPLYGAGVALGGLASVESPRAGTPSVAAAATLGAAVGILVTGLFVVPHFSPTNAYVGCIVLLSGAALIHGATLDREPERRVLDEEMSPWGRVRVEEARRNRPLRVERSLWVEDVRRGGLDQERRPLRRWEAGVLELLAGAGETPAPVLVVGGGGVALVEGLLATGRPVDVVEPNPVVWRMVLRHFEVPRSAPGLTVRADPPWEALRGAEGPYAAVVVDGDAFSPGEPFPLPPAEALAGALDALAPGGWVILGGRRGEPLLSEEGGTLLASLLQATGSPSRALYGGADDTLVVLSRDGVPGATSLGGLGSRPVAP